jgi:hypothetical protein
VDYSAVVYNGRQYITIARFNTFEELCEKVQGRWKILKYSDFDIMDKEDETAVDTDGTLRHNLKKELKLYIKRKSAGFSKFKSKDEDALSAIGSLFVQWSYIPVNDEIFVTIPENIVASADLKLETKEVVRDIMRRVETIDRRIATEYTMREFISPVLIGVIKLMLKYLKDHQMSTSLLLVSEKLVIGRLAHGPVDYVLIYDFLDIILTEAKKQDIKDGIIQNLLQQRASLDFLSNVLLDFNLTGRKRKEKFDEIFRDVSSVPTCAIVSTGEKWVFTVCERQPDGKTYVRQSNEISIKLDGSEEELTSSLEVLLSKIANLIHRQIEKLTNNEALNKRRKSFPSNDSIMEAEMYQTNDILHEIVECPFDEVDDVEGLKENGDNGIDE